LVHCRLHVVVNRCKTHIQTRITNKCADWR
jgi:hypothetical protein